MSARSGAVVDAGAPVTFSPTSLGAFALPQVNLLPPEIRANRTLGRVKVRLALALLGLVLLIALGYVFAALQERNAAEDLAFKQDEVNRLVAEQQEYSVVNDVKSEIAGAEAAREFGMSTEILWADYILAIEAVAPDGWRIASLATATPTPLEVPVLGLDPLTEPGIGSIIFTGRAATVPDVGAWLDALNSVPGFSGASFSSTEITDDEGVAYYETAATVNVDESLFALRFAPEEAQP